MAETTRYSAKPASPASWTQQDYISQPLMLVEVIIGLHSGYWNMDRSDTNSSKF